MHNPTMPAVELTIDGARYLLRFDFEAIATAEDIVGRSLLTGLRQQDIQAPSVSLVRAMLFACLLAEQSITYAEAKALVTRKNLADVWGKVLEAWTAGMVEPDEKAEQANPTEASAS